MIPKRDVLQRLEAAVGDFELGLDQVSRKEVISLLSKVDSDPDGQCELLILDTLLLTLSDSM